MVILVLKSGLLNLTPKPPTKTQFLTYFVALSEPFGRFGPGVLHPRHEYDSEFPIHETNSLTSHQKNRALVIYFPFCLNLQRQNSVMPATEVREP